MNKLIKFEEITCSLLILILTILTLIQVIVRYVLHLSVPWIEEIVRYLMIYLVYIGSAVAVYRKEHLNIELLDIILNKRKMRFINLTHQILISIFVGFFVYVSIKFIIDQIKIGQVTPALQISMGGPMSALVVGSLLMFISGISSLYKILFVKKGVN